MVPGKQQSNSMCFQICFIICDDWGRFGACAQFMGMMLFLGSFIGCIVRNQIDANSGSSRNSRLYVPPAAHQYRFCSISLSSGEVNMIAIVLGAFCTSQDCFCNMVALCFSMGSGFASYACCICMLLPCECSDVYVPTHESPKSGPGLSHRLMPNHNSKFL